MVDYDQDNSEVCKSILKTRDGISRLALYQKSVGRLILSFLFLHSCPMMFEILCSHIALMLDLVGWYRIVLMLLNIISEETVHCLMAKIIENKCTYVEGETRSRNSWNAVNFIEIESSE